MQRFFPSITFLLAGLSGSPLAEEYKLIASPTNFGPGDTATFIVSGTPASPQPVLSAPTGSGVVCPAGMMSCTAPATAGSLAMTGSVTIAATFPGTPPASAPLTTTITLTGPFEVS